MSSGEEERATWQMGQEGEVGECDERLWRVSVMLGRFGEVQRLALFDGATKIEC